MISSLTSVFNLSRASPDNAFGTLSIDNGTNAPIPNVSIRVSVPFKAPLLPDFSNLAFYLNNTLLSSWMETLVSGKNATVWIKISTLPSGTVEIKAQTNNPNPGTSVISDAFFAYKLLNWYPTDGNIRDPIIEASGGKWVGVYAGQGMAPDGGQFSGPITKQGIMNFYNCFAVQAKCYVWGSNCIPTIIVGGYMVKYFTAAGNKSGTICNWPSQTEYQAPNSSVSLTPTPTGSSYMLTVVVDVSSISSYVNGILLASTSTTDTGRPAFNSSTDVRAFLTKTLDNSGLAWYDIKIFRTTKQLFESITNNTLSVSSSWVNDVLNSLNATNSSLAFYYKFLPSDYDAVSQKYKNYATNAYDLSLVSNATISTTEKYRSSAPSSLYLNDGYAQINADFRHSTNGFAVSFWIKNMNLNTDYARILLFGRGATLSNAVPRTELFVTYNGSVPYVGITNSTVSDVSTQLVEPINNGTWTHVVWVISYTAPGGKNNALYVNGELGSTFATSYPDTSVTRTYNFIGENYYSNNRLKAYMNELRIYNRTLTADEVKALYFS